MNVKTSTSDLWLYKSDMCLTDSVEGYLDLLMHTNRQLHVECSWQCYDCDNKWQTTTVLLFIRLLAAWRQRERGVRYGSETERVMWEAEKRERRTDGGRCW